MRRRCDGNDPNLIAYPHEDNPADCPSLTPTHAGGSRAVCRCPSAPCTCGLAFDDVRRMVIYPHHRV